MEENKVTSTEPEKLEDSSTCTTPKPPIPAVGLPGDWQCKGGEWIWVDDIG